jgi:hypothetical protein
MQLVAREHEAETATTLERNNVELQTKLLEFERVKKMCSKYESECARCVSFILIALIFGCLSVIVFLCRLTAILESEPLRVNTMKNEIVDLQRQLNAIQNKENMDKQAASAVTSTDELIHTGEVTNASTGAITPPCSFVYLCFS